MTPTDGINTGTSANLLRLYASTAFRGNFPDGTIGNITFSNVRIIKNDGTILWNYGMQSQAIVLKTIAVATENTKTLLEESSVYPNPVENNLTIDLGEADHARLRLFDIAGSLIVEKQITDNKSLLEVSKLSQGVYLIELSNEIGKITHRVVK